MDPVPLEIGRAFSVAGQRVLVTGAAGWLGYKIVEVYLTNGARVVMSDRQGPELEEAAARLKAKGELHVVPADLTDTAALKTLATSAVEKLGGLDVLVNNGGIAYSGPLDRLADEEFDRIYQTNVRSVWLLTRHCLEALKASGGCVINMASVNGHRPCFAGSLYTSSKAAVLNMTRELAVELAPARVRVNSISPGPINNVHGRLGRLRELVRSEHLDPILVRLQDLLSVYGSTFQPWPEAGRPVDVAMGCVYLSSPAGRFLTGADLLIDGGHLHGFPRPHTGEPDFWSALHEALAALPMEAWVGERPSWVGEGRTKFPMEGGSKR